MGAAKPQRRAADGAAALAYISTSIRSFAAGAALQVLELIILAALAAVVLYQLYAVLGRRVGRGPDALPDAPPSVASPDGPRALAGPGDAQGAMGGLAAVRASDPNFDVGRFLQGARGAYQMIVKAYADGDRAALKPLLAANVMASFEAGIQAREAEGRTEAVEFLQPPRADLETVQLKGDLAQAAVRFLAEIRSRTKDAAGEAVDDRRTAEIWTFERSLKSRNPNWTLIHVDAAEA
jgi:predicted lipid-binding transport protein (Tim44 family)